MSASRLRLADLPGVAISGLRTRRLRAALAVFGIAIGVASLVGVLGVTGSSQADLVQRIERLGTNLLTVQAGSGLTGPERELPATAAPSIGLVAGVQRVSATAALPGVSVYRNDLVPAYLTGGLAVRATDTGLLAALQGHLLRGAFLTPATSVYPVVVLGFDAAVQLGFADLTESLDVWMGGRWFHVIGILDRVGLAPDVDRDVLVGLPAAAGLLRYDGHPTRVYVRADPDRVTVVRSLLARTVDPERPDQVGVSRPSDALAAQLAVQSSGVELFLGLSAIALLVGGVGIANVMFISVLERRSEIGLRRALGASRGHVGVQFLAESALLSALGGGLGVGLGAVATAGWAAYQGWQLVVPPAAVGGGVLVALLVGGAAGAYPALRAARLAPTEALRS
ncbi:MAG: ABC transporter permease [Candidatus Dormibacteraeota bacterium]|nr:ABC transporter permease [Candidatus Dormibacteraeota bacterium]